MLLECLLFVNKCFNIYGNENRLNCQLRDWLADVVVRTTCRLKSKGQADERGRAFGSIDCGIVTYSDDK